VSQRLRFLLGLLGLLLLAPGHALAVESTAAPAWSILPLATPTNFVPGDTEHEYTYQARIANIGGAASDGSPITVRDVLPPGLEVKGIEMPLRTGANSPTGKDYGDPSEGFCQIGTAGPSQTVTCTISEGMPEAQAPAFLPPGEERSLVIRVFAPGSIADGTTLYNQISVEGGGAPAATVTADNRASDQEATPGFSFSRVQAVGPDGLPFTEAGGHPFQFVSSFSVHTNPPAPTSSSAAKVVPAGGDLKDIRVALPPGLVGNPTSVRRCTAQQFMTFHQKSALGTGFSQNGCPDSSAVGIVLLDEVEGVSGTRLSVPIYNLVSPPGVAAQLGFQIFNLPFYIDAEVETGSGGELQVVGTLRNASQAKRVTAATVILWGTPADERHDPIRGGCVDQLESSPISLGNCESGQSPPFKPFLRMPTNCSSVNPFISSFDNWTHPGEFFSEPTETTALTGCASLPFAPKLPSFRPTSSVADSPTGLSVDVHIPQALHEAPTESAQADLRNVTVRLPPGLLVNPSSANGLSSCSPAQIGLNDEEPSTCPASSRIGEVSVDTPLLDHPLPGDVFVAAPYDNPFGTLLAIYITVDDPISGVVVKIPSRITPDPATGQLTATVSDAPQVPFEDFRLEFFAGARAALRTPATCELYSTQASLTPWSAPQSGGPVAASDTYAIVSAPAGGPCPTSPGAMPDAPSFDAGTLATQAGSYSPLVIHLRREDGSQEFASVTVSPPPGLLGKLAGIPYCSDAALATAAARSGREEQAAPSCPAASRVGTVYVGAGAGSAPYYVQGKAYLAGPYKGTPLSLAIVTPAVAGPYDLGTVVVRVALRVDLRTAQITADSDPIPHLLQGILLDVRSIDVRLDRPDFTLNPTDCSASRFLGTETSVLGHAAPLQSRFQVDGCRGLKFKPKLSIKLTGKPKRSGHPALKAVLTYPKGGGYANIARAQVGLPHSEFLDQGNLDKVCTQPELQSQTCPKRSIYGRAKAWTPLLDKPLEGPVYLGVGFGYKLPALVADLNGQIRILLVGKVDTDPKEGIRSTFEAVPDAPVSRFVLEMKGGPKYGLLENSENICRKPQRAAARFVAQSGKAESFQSRIGNECGQKGKHRKPTHR
jgi:hypothetical protein